MTNVVDFCSGLSELAAQVRSTTVTMLTAADPAMLMWTPLGTSNHMLWHAGHALWAGDVLTVQPITGRSELSPEWEAKFGQHSQPAAHSDWPDGPEVGRLLELQLDRVLTLFTNDASRIAERAAESSRLSGWPLLAGIIHGWHDEARHQGEMHLLSKLYHHRHS
jgi:hypothetical protein